MCPGVGCIFIVGVDYRLNDGVYCTQWWSGLYVGSNYCQSHVLVCQSHVLVDMLMLTVKLVCKLSNCA